MTTSVWKRVAVLGGDGGDADDGVGVFGVDVEDGNGQALGDVGGEARGVGLFGLGGEAEEVVDDDVDGAADGVAVDAGEIEGFGPDALAGEGGVAVDDDGQDLIAVHRAPMRSCAARARPMATGSTASRWLGLETRCRATVPPVRAANRRWRPCGTSRHRRRGCCAGSTSSNLAKISAGGRPMVLTMTLRRPRWLMPRMAR